MKLEKRIDRLEGKAGPVSPYCRCRSGVAIVEVEAGCPGPDLGSVCPNCGKRFKPGQVRVIVVERGAA